MSDAAVVELCVALCRVPYHIAFAYTLHTVIQLTLMRMLR